MKLFAHESEREEFARLMSILRRMSPKPMNLMSEKVSDLPRGLIGTNLKLGPFDALFPLPPAFSELVSPFMGKCHGDDAFEFNLLSKDPAPLGLFCYFHGHPSENGITEFTIRLQRKPNDEPPKAITEQSDQLGGVSRVQSIVQLLGGVKIKCQAKLHGHVLDPKIVPERFKIVRKKEDFLPLKFEGQTMIFSHEDAELQFSVSEDGDPIYFECSSQIEITLNDSFVEQACDRLWSPLKEIFGHAIEPA